MSLARVASVVVLFSATLTGCGDGKTVIPKEGFTEEQKQAIKAEDAKIANEESHGTKKK